MKYSVLCFLTGVKLSGERPKMKFFLCVIGMVMIIEGLPYFGFPENMKQMMRKVMEIPDETLRKFGFVLMLCGLVLVYIGKM